MKVLVADDDDISREILVNTLVHSGFQVVAVNDGAEAFAEIRTGNFQMVITDWDMPNMNGVELCRAIRQGGFASYIYLILLTTHDTSQKTVEGLSAGADDFITKPFDPPELVVRVRNGERVLSLETREMTIFALAKLAESRDTDTGAHLERVRSYCRALAEQLATDDRWAAKINGEFVQLLYSTSPLHDIGKVGIPDCVLLKAGMLNQREFELMKTHAELGAKTLEAALEQFPNAKFLKMARDIALTHHERWDGSGYPRGLKAEQIPLCGRIVALADVYDALTSKRVYKECYTHDLARTMIVEAAGKHFDPDIVAGFLACEDQFIAIRRQYSNEQPSDQTETSTAREERLVAQR